MAISKQPNGVVMRELSEKELLELIDERARFLLRISGKEFMRRYRAGKFAGSTVAAPITILADLVESR